MSLSLWPKVGVGVMVFRPGKILLGQRIGSHGEGTWSLPGGHMEPFESVEAAASRETIEETGLYVTDFQCGPWVNTVFESEKKHYITVFVATHVADDAKALVMEPDKCLAWQWFDFEGLPTPLFLPLAELFEREQDVLSQFHSTRLKRPR